MKRLSEIVWHFGADADTTQKGVPSFAHLASLAQAKGEWRRAHDLWQKFVEQQPSSVNGWVQLGNMRNELADYPGALAAMVKGSLLDPNSYDAVAGKAGVHERAGQWRDAYAAWMVATQLAAEDGGRLEHAYSHAVLSAHHVGDSATIAKVTMLAAAAVPGFLDQTKSLSLRAKLLLHANQPAKAKMLLQQHLARHPNDLSCRFDMASICLNDGEYAHGLDILATCLAQQGIDDSFIWLAADLHERLGHWTTVLSLCEQMLETNTPQNRFICRGFEVAVRLGDLIAARRFARLYSSRNKGELKYIDQLRAAYENAGEIRRARYLCRWLVRRWPHSDWHRGNAIVLTARDLGITAADRLVREYNNRYGRSSATDRAYCQAAFAANAYSEAQRRLEWYLQTPETRAADSDAEVLLGYVLADAQGLDVAEQHFLSLAARTFQSRTALVGLVHMASRRRDTLATRTLWGKISALYPEDTIAGVEHARAAYNCGDPQQARHICEQRLRTLPSDVTMGEFYVWLLVATGHYTSARNYIPKLVSYGGPSWAALEAAIHCAGQFESLDQDWDSILALLPRASTQAASSRVYHCVRLLQHFERADLASSLLQASNIDRRATAWIAPYCRSERLTVNAELSEPANTIWRHVSCHVTDDPAVRLRQMSAEQVEAALQKPHHDHPVVHVINKFEQARGGSELHALDVAAQISRYAKVELWSSAAPHPEFSTRHNVQAIDPSRGKAPHGGVFVFIGVYFPINWLVGTRPERIIFLYNTFEAPALFMRIAEAFTMTGIKSELLFCSDMMGEECNLPGYFEPSPIDINLFVPRLTPQPHRFTIGRHSRDVIEKHHRDDDAIYKAVAALGGRSVVLGGTAMRSVFQASPNLDLLPARTTGIVEFLQSLDAYLYRTSTWVEPWGRVVIEAMACELPVLVHDVGGYAQVIRHEENGLLFHTTAEAVALVKRLAQDPALRLRLGKAARCTVEQLLDQKAISRLVLFYLLRS